MKALFSELRPALMATGVLAVVTCGVYPALVTAAAQGLFKEKAHSSLIVDPDGTVRGSALLGQAFAGERYFHPRPSAAGAGYDAASSGGSNLGPTSRKLKDALQERIAAYRTLNGLAPDTPVPADAVTASGSGLDPQISERNAELQAARVARTRGLGVEKVRELIARCTTGPGLGFLGVAGVNVLMLNRALDGL